MTKLQQLKLASIGGFLDAEEAEMITFEVSGAVVILYKSSFSGNCAWPKCMYVTVLDVRN